MSNVQNVRSLWLSAAITTLVLGACAEPAWAQITQISTVVDENGHGTLNGFQGLVPLPFSIIADPGPGGKPNVLAYNLLNPPGLVVGDVVITEAGAVGSDLIRFDAATGSGTLFFYSDQDAGIDAIADVGLPTGRNTNLLTMGEVSLGVQGFGAIYTPTAGQPGFVAGAAVPVVYTFISDPVPEPGSFLLVLPGALVMFLRRRTRNTARDVLSV